MIDAEKHTEKKKVYQQPKLVSLGPLKNVIRGSSGDGFDPGGMDPTDVGGPPPDPF